MNFLKTMKLIFIAIVIIALLFVGYQGYLAYQKWQQNEKSHDQLLIESLKANEGMIAKLSTKLSEIEIRVVNDTAKTITEPKPDHTYESLKEQVIELNKDKDTNKEEIEALREELSEQRKAFLKSENTMLIKTADGEKILLYRDENNNWQPASEGIDKIIEHKELSEDVAILSEKEIVDEVTKRDLKFGGYYSLDKTYGIILSKGIFTVKDYSLNVSLLSDLKDLEGIKFGVNINYSVKENLELGIGVTMDKTYYMALQYSF